MGTFSRICEITKTGLSPLHKSKLFFVYYLKSDNEKSFNICSHAIDSIYSDVEGKFVLSSPNELDFVKKEFEKLTDSSIDVSLLNECLKSNKLIETDNAYLGVYPILSLLAKSFVDIQKDSNLIKNLITSTNEDFIRDYSFNDSIKQLEEMKESISRKTPLKMRKILTDLEKISKVLKQKEINTSMTSDCFGFVSLDRMLNFFGVEEGFSKYIEMLSIKTHLKGAAYSFEPSYYLTQGHYTGQVEHFEAVLNVLKEISEDH